MRHYSFIDYATQAYLALAGVLVLLFHGQMVTHWPVWVLGHISAVGLIHGLLLTRGYSHSRWLAILRSFYPIFLFPFLYCETGHLNRMFFQDYLDPFFIGLEDQLFGTQPSLIWMEKMPWHLLSELFYLAYFSYYLMILGVGVVLFYRNRHHFQHYLSVIAFMMYVCFICYLMLPVVGPNGFYQNDLRPRMMVKPLTFKEPPAYPATVQSGPFYGLMQFIYHNFETPGAAFPSSHVAVALGTLYFSCRYWRRVGLFHGVAVVWLCAATVYCRYHYVVDVLAGMAAAAVLLPLGNWLYQRCTECGMRGSDE